MKIVNTSIVNLDKKICLLGDIHFNLKYNTKILDKIIKNVKINKPDYICLVGDVIDNSIVETYDISKLYDFINDLSKIGKVIISLGNHDITYIHNRKKHEYRYPNKYVLNIKKMNNVVFLDNEKYIDNDICFIGYSASFDTYYKEDGLESSVIDELNKILVDIDNTKFNILLSHNPLYVSKDTVYKNVNNYSKLNLILSGHTHNGILPLFTNKNKVFISPQKRLFVSDGRGVFNKGDVLIIVTGGVVKLSYCSNLFRYFNFLFPISIDYINGDKR